MNSPDNKLLFETIDHTKLPDELKKWLAIAAGVEYETSYDHASGKMTFTTAPCSVTMRGGIPHVQLPNRG